MNFYAQAKNIYAKVFMNCDEFKKELDTLAEQALEKPIAIILQLDKSQRHSTGLFLKAKQSGEIEAFMFDTMGLNLPARPCGLRYYEDANLKRVMQLLNDKDIRLLITPINVRLSLQKDFYSCLFATVLFFESIIKEKI
jgi:hypothetical protein